MPTGFGDPFGEEYVNVRMLPNTDAEYSINAQAS
jgi:hypothetical protein